MRKIVILKSRNDVSPSALIQTDHPLPQAKVDIISRNESSHKMTQDFQRLIEGHFIKYSQRQHPELWRPAARNCYFLKVTQSEH